MDNKKVVSFPATAGESNDKATLMFCICGGKVFYFLDSDIINFEEINEGNYLELKVAYTVDMQVFPGVTQHPLHGKINIPQAVNLVNTFINMKLFYDGIGYIPSNSGIMKSIRESQTGIVG